MKTLRNLIILLFTLLLLGGCAVSYVPNSVNTPLFDQKGEALASVNAGFSGYDVQTAYAVTDHIGVMLNGSFDSEQSDPNYKHSHTYVEAGAGWSGKIGQYGRYEIYTGYGMGPTETYYRRKNLIGNFFVIDSLGVFNQRLFLQPSAGFKSEYFEASFSSRFVFLHLSPRYYLQRIEGNPNSETSYPARPNTFYWEPVLTIKGGGKKLKGYIQGGISWPLQNNPDYYNNIFIFSLGLQYRFNLKK